jgi:hypothetical protein
MSGLLGEGLLAPSGVRLFGRDYTGLTIADLGLNPTSNDPLVTQLSNAKPVDGRPPYGLAQIYGFSYLGNYFKLASPIVMLVWGDGIKVPGGDPAVSLSNLCVDFKAKLFAKVKMWCAIRLTSACGSTSASARSATSCWMPGWVGQQHHRRPRDRAVRGCRPVGSCRPFRGRGSIGTRWSFQLIGPRRRQAPPRRTPTHRRERRRREDKFFIGHDRAFFSVSARALCHSGSAPNAAHFFSPASDSQSHEMRKVWLDSRSPWSRSQPA